MAGWPVVSSNVVQSGYQKMATTGYAILPLILAVLLAKANLAPVKAAGDPNNDYYYLITTALQARMAPDDLVVTRGNILDVYIPFYARHPGYLSLREIEYNVGNDRAKVMADLMSRLDEALAVGKTIWLDQMVLDETRSAERNPFGLSQEEIDTLKARYPLQPDILWNGSNVFYSTPHEQQPDATSWSFAESLAGWRAWGVDMPRLEQQGWCFSGGADPQLQSPQLDIDANRWGILTLELSLETDQSYAQLFWRSKEQDYSLENSIQIDTQRGRHTYSVSLTNVPGWEGIITQLRLDPAPGAADTAAPTVTVCLYNIQLQ
jgi:hypothetical protein